MATTLSSSLMKEKTQRCACLALCSRKKYFCVVFSTSLYGSFDGPEHVLPWQERVVDNDDGSPRGVDEFDVLPLNSCSSITKCIAIGVSPQKEGKASSSPHSSTAEQYLRLLVSGKTVGMNWISAISSWPSVVNCTIERKDHRICLRPFQDSCLLTY